MKYVVTRRQVGGFSKRARRSPYTVLTLHRPTCRTITNQRHPEHSDGDYPPQAHVRFCKICNPNQEATT